MERRIKRLETALLILAEHVGNSPHYAGELTRSVLYQDPATFQED